MDFQSTLGPAATGTRTADPLPGERKEVKVDPSLYDAYAGTYELSPAFAITVTREGDHLFAQATGQPKFEIFPESETRFFLKVVDAQVEFVRGPDGKVASLILHQNGRTLPGTKNEIYMSSIGRTSPPCSTRRSGRHSR